MSSRVFLPTRSSLSSQLKKGPVHPSCGILPSSPSAVRTRRDTPLPALDKRACVGKQVSSKSSRSAVPSSTFTRSVVPPSPSSSSASPVKPLKYLTRRSYASSTRSSAAAAASFTPSVHSVSAARDTSTRSSTFSRSLPSRGCPTTSTPLSVRSEKNASTRSTSTLPPAKPLHGRSFAPRGQPATSAPLPVRSPEKTSIPSARYSKSGLRLRSLPGKTSASTRSTPPVPPSPVVRSTPVARSTTSTPVTRSAAPTRVTLSNLAALRETRQARFAALARQRSTPIDAVLASTAAQTAVRKDKSRKRVHFAETKSVVTISRWIVPGVHIWGPGQTTPWLLLERPTDAIATRSRQTNGFCWLEGVQARNVGERQHHGRRQRHGPG
ncbi:uncharacterized protein BO97DRAFT_417185 [Aspergillus homomorphus CBS 101889]|uniref:Uncharacterized protein n=1 Tax=Aspergillus homomorphus (strain CBS 101889) TaxID=1450537 RepID=A0A395HNQ6_ASPHC|nr:hypothetical protein BO97DRAFT_417185 [Aspergillus homomorphus CBS 101889]RAL09119.1 hypothetical protein BO97DRAFT_417185 [Aspergillus homomorphus CBS 101889]